jgi:hypothetical protein
MQAYVQTEDYHNLPLVALYLQAAAAQRADHGGSSS